MIIYVIIYLITMLLLLVGGLKWHNKLITWIAFIGLIAFLIVACWLVFVLIPAM